MLDIEPATVPQSVPAAQQLGFWDVVWAVFLGMWFFAISGGIVYAALQFLFPTTPSAP